MINIIYQKETLNNTLLINISNLEINNIKNHNEFTILKNNENLVGINIFNFSKYAKLKNGLVNPSQKFLTLIKKITGLDLSKYYEKNFVVGIVKKVSKIQNTHLHICEVDVKDKVLTIVCGASNVKTNKKVVVANLNTILPNGNYIKLSTVYSYYSYGMLCSYNELNLSANNDKKGIIILEDKYKVGSLYQLPFANK